MDVIIIGAGAAGLMAAKKLTEKGVKVLLLEARDRLGGRIYTTQTSTNKMHAEAGPEYIHGNLEVTLNLLKEAGIKYQQTAGDWWEVTKGQWHQSYEVANENLIMQKLKDLKKDMSIASFLQKYFAEEKYTELCAWLTSYIEGYYAGETSRVSAFAFFEEWSSEDDQQYRPEGGYGNMINFLANSIKNKGGLIQTSTVVKSIRWQKNQVEIIDERNHIYAAHKVIVAVPLGVWQANENERGGITFTPDLSQQKDAAKQMGFGGAIKVLLFFKNAFWETLTLKQPEIKFKNLGFIISDEAVPTWWTQLPQHSCLLTGWIAGPKAIALKNADDDTILQQALTSLSKIFQVNENFLKQEMKTWQVFNWVSDPFTRGGYTFTTTASKEARKIFMQPVDDTLFFAGEALYDGSDTGTVEAALTSGLRVAKQVIITS